MATPTTVSSTPDAAGGQKAIDASGGMASPSTVSSTPPLSQRTSKKQGTLREQGEAREDRRSLTSSSRVKKNANFQEEDDTSTGKKNTPRKDEADGSVKAAWASVRTVPKMFQWSSGRDPPPDTRFQKRRLFKTETQKFGYKRKTAMCQINSVTAQPGTLVNRPKQSLPPRAREAWSEGSNSRPRSDTVAAAASLQSKAYRGAMESERCSRCTREAVWTACDVFWTFDPTWFAWSGGSTELSTTAPTGQLEHPKEITRDGYIAALSLMPTVDRLRTLRRSGLEQRFRKSAHPVTLKEWLRMIWPVATQHDMQMMERWAKLREAWSIVHNINFRSTDSELNRIFDLCTETGESEVPLGEFVRAQLLRPEECQKLFRTADLHHRLNKESDKSVLQTHFKTYVTADTQRRMKQEEEAMISNVSNWMGIVDKKGVQSS